MIVVTLLTDNSIQGWQETQQQKYAQASAVTFPRGEQTDTFPTEIAKISLYLNNNILLLNDLILCPALSGCTQSWPSPQPLDCFFTLNNSCLLPPFVFCLLSFVRKVTCCLSCFSCPVSVKFSRLYILIILQTLVLYFLLLTSFFVLPISKTLFFTCSVHCIISICSQNLICHFKFI